MSNNILESPKQFFESLTKEEFQMLLDEFEFKYEEKQSSITKENI